MKSQSHPVALVPSGWLSSLIWGDGRRERIFYAQILHLTASPQDRSLLDAAVLASFRGCLDFYFSKMPLLLIVI